jgi:hypothetical protein
MMTSKIFDKDRFVLTIDRAFATSLDLNSSINLLPDLDNPIPWALDKASHELMILATINAKKKLAKLFAERVYQPKLGYSLDAAEHLFCISGTVSTFLLCDRLCRLNRLSRFQNLNSLILPNVEYQLNAEQDTHDFMTKTVEVDPFFNQWIINRLLPDVPRTNGIVIPLYEIRNNRSKKSFTAKISKSLKEVGVKGAFNRLLLNISFKLVSRMRRGIWPFAKNSVPHNMNHFGESFDNKNFYWPFGPLVNLPDKLPLFSGLNFNHQKICRSDIQNLNLEIKRIFEEFLLSCDGEIYLPISTFDSITPLFIEMQSEISLELLGDACQWAIKKIEYYKTKSYYSGAPGGGALPALFTFAAKQLNKDVIGSQHSAWGGYLSYGPLVTELLMIGTDYYVTFGWKDPEIQLSHWRRAPVILPSPLLSYYASGSRPKKLNNRKKHVILAPGFLYRFPSIPNSFLKVDYIGLWFKKLESIVSAVTEQDIELTILMYNSTINALHEKMINKLISAGNGLAHLHLDPDFRIRKLIFSGDFYDSYDAIIWDLPAGGFAEALSMNINTFTLCDENMLSILPEGRSAIDSLRSTGIIFDKADELICSLKRMYLDNELHAGDEAQLSIARFQNDFSKISNNWEHEWLHYLNSLR